MHSQDADACRAAETQEVAEAGVVRQVEPEPYAIDEKEFAGESQLELTLASQNLLAHIAQLGESFLHRRVLDRVELYGAQRAVEGHDEIAATLSQVARAHWIR